MNEITGYIELPGAVNDAKEVYSWGHPELNGKIGLLENKKLLFQAFNIPRGQWVEIRVAFPRSLLQGTSNALEVNSPGLQKIIDDEKNYSSANAASAFHRAFLVLLAPPVFFLFALVIIASSILNRFGHHGLLDKVLKAVLLLALGGIIFVTVSPIAIVAGLEMSVFAAISEIMLFVLCWHFWGREPKVELPQIYEREVPFDYSPAVVETLQHQWRKKPTVKSLTAEILDLCLQGKLKLEKIKEKGFWGEKDSYKIHILNTSAENLPESETLLFKLIKTMARTKFEGIIFKHRAMDETPNEVTLEEVKKYLQHKPYKSQKWLESWKKAVEENAKSLGLFSKKDAIIPFIAGNILLSAILLFTNAALLFVVLPLALALNLAFPNILPNRSALGAEHYKRWMNLKKFLSDFSSLKEVPPELLVLWEKYLVYAIPLGVAGKVQKAMDNVFKDYHGEMHSSIFVGASFSGSDFASFGSSIGSFSSAFSSATATSGGGGFGGGGGGGAG